MTTGEGLLSQIEQAGNRVTYDSTTISAETLASFFQVAYVQQPTTTTSSGMWQYYSAEETTEDLPAYTTTTYTVPRTTRRSRRPTYYEEAGNWTIRHYDELMRQYEAVRGIVTDYGTAGELHETPSKTPVPFVPILSIIKFK